MVVNASGTHWTEPKALALSKLFVPQGGTTDFENRVRKEKYGEGNVILRWGYTQVRL